MKTILSMFVYLTIELPFWIPIQSGRYILASKGELSLRNDFWLISVANLVDGPIDTPFDFVVNEMQVADEAFLDRITGHSARYFHKRKMKTTFSRTFQIVPTKGAISAKPPEELWQQQINRVVFGLINPKKQLEMLEDINNFIRHYITLIGSQNPPSEVRQISFYDSSIRILVSTLIDNIKYLYPSKVAPDINGAELPYPIYRVRSAKKMFLFREQLQSQEDIPFHQIQWARAKNHLRESRFQEALMSASFVLESIVHLYLTKKKQTKRCGIARWVRELNPKGLENTCDQVAKLWVLRNDVVHKQQMIEEKEKETIREGIRGLASLREYLLSIAQPELIQIEKEFNSFLEPIRLGYAAFDSINRQVALSYSWLRERDNYEKPIQPKSEQSV